MKKVLVVGCGLDVLDKERGAFIDSYFDDVIIIKHAVLFINEFKRYTGTPTGLLVPFNEWYRYAYCEQLEEWEKKHFKEWYNETELEKARKHIYDCIYNSNIKKVILLPFSNDRYMYKFECPSVNIHGNEIITDIFNDNINIGIQATTSGLFALKYAIQHYDKVYYMGFDAELQSCMTKDKDGNDIKNRHYFTSMGEFYFPWKLLRDTSNYDQYFTIKYLTKKYSISHIDTIWRE